jgi:predicted DNA-binding antitoxin AbrB/MazE fold protein
MTIQATYRDGAFHPDQPVDLPENSRVLLTFRLIDGEDTTSSKDAEDHR